MRNIAQRTCAWASFSDQYRCPEEGRERFEISPSTHTVPRPRLDERRASRFKPETERIRRSSNGSWSESPGCMAASIRQASAFTRPGVAQ